MNLHVAAYPRLATADFERIQSFRRDHNSLYRIIDPHFTIVFSVADMTLADFAAEIKRQAYGVEAIRFCLRCAVINKDSFSDNYDAFLVPDEGFAGIVKLHDRLYARALSPHHRLDISYIPHISIANNTDPLAIKKIVDEWNEKDFAIEGTIDWLDIVDYDRDTRTITTVERIQLD